MQVFLLVHGSSFSSSSLEEKLALQKATFDGLDVPDELKSRTTKALFEQLCHHEQVVESKTQKKLCGLYGGWLPIPKPSDGYVNISGVTLTDDQKEFLNLGVNFAFAPKFSPQEKKAELEILYQDICKLHAEDKISVNPDIQEQLQAESTKNRSQLRRPALEPRLHRAAKQLRENPDIVIRKADKSQVFVVLDAKEYYSKSDEILNDKSKFTPISRNPVEKLKREANDLIDAANKHVKSDQPRFQRVTGEFKAGYFYGNVKLHKQGKPLRPIISQIPLPTYTLAKRLNDILSPYVPTDYSLKSSSEFIDLLRTRTRQGMLVSLDVSSLFTNVPLERTIAILAKYAYHHDTMAPPDIPEHIMCAMLRLCTTKAPYRCPQGRLFYQSDGVAMGSPLGGLFAQAFMASVEEHVLADKDIAPYMYYRYVDDILLDIKDDTALNDLKTRLEDYSGLTFTIERSVDNRISYLDVDIDASDDTKFVTKVHRKPTDVGKCLHGDSQCPDRYKISVIRSYVYRALKHCSSWDLVHEELARVKRMLVNNGYSVAMIDEQILSALNRHQQTSKTSNQVEAVHHIFYRNTMSPGYKTDEKVLQNIVHRNCKVKNPAHELRLNIYYKSPKSSSLVLRNNMTKDNAPLKHTNVIYHYKCKTEDCALLPNSGYIGMTTTSLSRRLTMHLQNGGPLTHMEKHHGQRLTRQTLIDNTTILAHVNTPRLLTALEAVYIRDMDPLINKQVNARGTLSLYDGAPLSARLL